MGVVEPIEFSNPGTFDFNFSLTATLNLSNPGVHLKIYPLQQNSSGNLKLYYIILANESENPKFPEPTKMNTNWTFFNTSAYKSSQLFFNYTRNPEQSKALGDDLHKIKVRFHVEGNGTLSIELWINYIDPANTKSGVGHPNITNVTSTPNFISNLVSSPMMFNFLIYSFFVLVLIFVYFYLYKKHRFI